MAIQQLNITREFWYNGAKLHDPGISMTAEKVRMFYAGKFPELTTAVVEGPVTSAGISRYTFKRAAGTKG